MLEKRAAEEQAERGEMALVSRLSNDIPFGIRALVEDPEVEGVWNSRTITSLHCDPAQRPRNPSSPPPTPTVKPKIFSSTSSTSIYDTADIGLASPDGQSLLSLLDSSLIMLQLWSHSPIQ